MTFTTLGQLISDVGNYDEYRPIWIDASAALTRDTPCYIVLGDASEYGEWEAIPPAAQDKGMKRFLSSGQIAHSEATLEMAKADYTEDELIFVLDEVAKAL